MKNIFKRIKKAVNVEETYPFSLSDLLNEYSIIEKIIKKLVDDSEFRLLKDDYYILEEDNICFSRQHYAEEGSNRYDVLFKTKENRSQFFKDCPDLKEKEIYSDALSFFNMVKIVNNVKEFEDIPLEDLKKINSKIEAYLYWTN